MATAPVASTSHASDSENNPAFSDSDEDMIPYEIYRDLFYDSDADINGENLITREEWDAANAAKRAERRARRDAGEPDEQNSDSDSSTSDHSYSSDSDSEGGDAVQEPLPPAFPTGYDHEWLGDFIEESGPIGVDDDATAGQLFDLFFSEEVLDMLVTETNRYADVCIANAAGRQGDAPDSRVNKWKPVTTQDMKSFLALVLLMGIDQRPSYELSWSTDKYLSTPGLREIMPRNRFLSILCFLHVVDNNDAIPRGQRGHDRGFKIRPLINLLVPLWQRYYAPAKEISVDESMIPFKGRTGILQYLPKKPNKWGLKAWGLADAKSGYMWNWSLYLGKEKVAAMYKDVGVAHRVVVSLAQPLYHRRHVLYMDNFFTCGPLFRELAQNGMGACGTIRLNRKGIPDSVKAAKPKLGDAPVIRQRGPLRYIIWKDKRVIYLMTTVHTGETFQKTVRARGHEDNRRVVDKPCAIESYTQFMGGVDRADKAMSYYMNAHRSLKWWKKVFFYLLEVCFCNALIIWRAKHPGERVLATKFRMDIVHHLQDGAPGVRPRHIRQPAAPAPAGVPQRLVVGPHHFPAISEHRVSGDRLPRLDCVVCSVRGQNRHQTTTVCSECKVPLCPWPCFQRYHKLVNYKKLCTRDMHNSADPELL